MNPRPRKAASSVALFLVFALTQVFVQANIGTAGLTGKNAAPTATQDQMAGKLTTSGNKPVLVNGNNAGSGDTVLSGATMETPAGVGATLNFGPAGSLNFAPETKGTIQFSEGRISVQLVQGCVTLTTHKGTTGEVTTPDGKTRTTDPAKGGVIDTCSKRVPAAPILAGAAAGGLAGSTLFALGIAGFATAIAAGATLSRGRRPNPSSATP
jgi:hypothetical protein